MPEEKKPTPRTTSSGDATPALHSFNQTDHPNHSPRGTPRCIPGYRCPFPLFPRHRLPRESPVHPGPGSIQNGKTNRNSLTSQQWPRLCYAAGRCRNLGSIPRVHAAHRALLDERPGPAAACSSRRGLRGSAGRVAAAPPAAQLPARPSFCFRRRPPPAWLPSASTLGHPPPGAGH